MVAHGHLGEGRDFFQVFSGLGRCWGMGPWGSLTPHHVCVRAGTCTVAHMGTYSALWWGGGSRGWAPRCCTGPVW
jgi:hypothetical protein